MLFDMLLESRLILPPSTQVAFVQKCKRIQLADFFNLTVLMVNDASTFHFRAKEIPRCPVSHATPPSQIPTHNISPPTGFRRACSQRACKSGSVYFRQRSW